MKTTCITIAFTFICLFNLQAQRNGTHPGDSLSRSQLKQGGALIPILEDFDFDFYAKIRSFLISYTQNNQFYETKVKGNIIPKEYAAELSKLKIGTRINFDKIAVDMPDGTIRNVNTYYYVKK